MKTKEGEKVKDEVFSSFFYFFVFSCVFSFVLFFLYLLRLITSGSERVPMFYLYE